VRPPPPRAQSRSRQLQLAPRRGWRPRARASSREWARADRGGRQHRAQSPHTTNTIVYRTAPHRSFPGPAAPAAPSHEPHAPCFRQAPARPPTPRGAPAAGSEPQRQTRRPRARGQPGYLAAAAVAAATRRQSLPRPSPWRGPPRRPPRRPPASAEPTKPQLQKPPPQGQLDARAQSPEPNLKPQAAPVANWHCAVAQWGWRMGAVGGCGPTPQRPQPTAGNTHTHTHTHTHTPMAVQLYTVPCVGPLEEGAVVVLSDPALELRWGRRRPT
jgi:hypothetical protein